MSKVETSKAPEATDKPVAAKGKEIKAGQHKATYASDKMYGGFNIRVIGPYANRFMGRKVPVVTKNDDERIEELGKLIWSGTDTDTGKPVALYEKVKTEKTINDEIPF